MAEHDKVPKWFSDFAVKNADEHGQLAEKITQSYGQPAPRNAGCANLGELPLLSRRRLHLILLVFAALAAAVAGCSDTTSPEQWAEYKCAKEEEHRYERCLELVEELGLDQPPPCTPASVESHKIIDALNLGLEEGEPLFSGSKENAAKGAQHIREYLAADPDWSPHEEIGDAFYEAMQSLAALAEAYAQGIAIDEAKESERADWEVYKALDAQCRLDEDR